MEIEIVGCLKDNYAYLVHDEASGHTMVIDPSQSQPVLHRLKEKNWKLSSIVNTHHHWDHVGGNLELKQATGCKIYCSRYDRDRIPGVDDILTEENPLYAGQSRATVISIPGHTLGHIAIFFEAEQVVFTGDTLFKLGSGRLFEGTAEQMWRSINRLRNLPDDTLVYCGHEYAKSNSEFALSIEPGNKALQACYTKIIEQRKKRLPTVPSSMGDEKRTNPFLRVESLEIRKSLSVKGSDLEVFSEMRRRKDEFKLNTEK